MFFNSSVPCQTFLLSSWSVPPFYLQDLKSSLLSLLWILFQVDCIFSSFIWSCGFLPCSFICSIFPCHLILSNLLCLWFLFYRLQGHSSSCFWYLIPGGWGWFRGFCRIPVGKDWCLHSGGWSWVFSLRWAGLCQVVCFGVSMSLVQFQAACLLMGGAVLLSCWLFGVRHPALEPKSRWVELSLGVEMKTSGRIHASLSFLKPGLSGGPAFWTWFSYIEGSGLTPGWEPRPSKLYSTAAPSTPPPHPPKRKQNREQPTKQNNSKIKTNNENKS